MLTNLKALMRDESGVTVIEYAVLGGLIIAICITIISGIGTKVSTFFNTVSTNL